MCGRDVRQRLHTMDMLDESIHVSGMSECTVLTPTPTSVALSPGTSRPNRDVVTRLSVAEHINPRSSQRGACSHVGRSEAAAPQSSSPTLSEIL